VTRLSLIENCENCAYRAKALLCDLAGDDLAAFQRMKHSFSYEPHQSVFYEGHSCLGFYVLCHGKVKLTRSSARGQRQIIGILDSGEVIEKHAFRGGAIHEVTCETLEPSRICLIEKEPYLALIKRNGDLALKVIQLLSSELGLHMDQLDQFTFKTSRERLAGLLIQLSDRFGKRAGEQIQVGIKLRREEVAEMAGITVETAIRLLSAFREEGLIALEGRTVTLLNPGRLNRIAKL
jgi:CRP/FNR family transcriptional regulator